MYRLTWAAAAALLVVSCQVSGADLTWVGGKDTNFLDPNNWSPVAYVVGNVLTIGAGSPNNPVFSGDTNTSRPNGLNTTTAGHLTVSRGALYAYGNNTLNGSVVVEGGYVNLRGDVYIGNAGTGVLTLNGGSFAYKNTLYIGRGTGGDGTINVWGGSLWLTGLPVISSNGGVGRINIKNDRFIYCPGNQMTYFQGLVSSGTLTTVPGQAIIISYNSNADKTVVTATSIVPASEPNPTDGASDYPVTKLTWRPGTQATSSDVYLGTDAAVVTAATKATTGVYLGSTGSDNFPLPMALVSGMKYYWRIDSVTPSGLLTGDVWSFTPADIQAPRFMERLGRGVIATVQNSNGTVYVGWRLLATDRPDVAFNIYRNGVKRNSSPLGGTTDFTDTGVTLTQVNYYYVRPVVNGRELAESSSYVLAANTPVRKYVPIPLATIPGAVGTYSVFQGWTGDLDGDGEYDFVVVRNSDALATYKTLEAYRRDGAFMWRVQLGPNIQEAYTIVYDLDCDGKTEVVTKTSEATVFGDGTAISDVDGDGITDYRIVGAQYEVMAGPEFLSVLDGQTGAELARTDFINRGTSTDWGDNYGHRQNFIREGVAYFDGVRPSIVFQRGPGDYMKIYAWDYVDGQLTLRWTWFNHYHADLPAAEKYADFQQWRIVDMDEDGRDEIALGGAVIDEYGKPLYGTELGHGDRFQITKFDPDRPGMQCFAIQQNNPTYLGTAYYDVRDGSMLGMWYGTSVWDVGRGDAGDIDPTHRGVEFWSTMANTYDCTGAAIYPEHPWPSLMIWWDGDLCREILSAADGDGRNPVLNKWNYTSRTEGRLLSLYSDDGSYSVFTPYAARAPFYGDIYGDWREELLVEQTDHQKMRLYTTPYTTTTRIYNLMQNPYYRLAMTHKGYLVSPYTDYYLGTDMNTPPKPYIQYTGNGTGRIMREFWTGISGTPVSNLTLNANYPNLPTGSQFLLSLEGPTSWGINYGTRIRGYLHPAATGDYTFWIAGDDDCELWLSTDANPANAVKIAYVSGYTNSRQWDKYPEQQSATISLVAGHKYYIDVLHKQGVGGDNIGVAWQGPGISQQVIEGRYLSPWTGVLPGDTAGDNRVNMIDVGDVAGDWLSDDCDMPLELDMNGDCVINFTDFAIGAMNWTTAVP